MVCDSVCTCEHENMCVPAGHCTDGLLYVVRPSKPLMPDLGGVLSGV